MLAEAAFYIARFANTPESKHNPETYQQAIERYLKRFSKLPPLALKTVAKVAAAEDNRSIKADERLRPLPENLQITIELPADPWALAELITKYKAKSG